MPSLHDYDVKMPNFMFLWRTLTSDNKLFFLSLNLSAVSKKSTPGKFSYIWHFPRIGINATLFKYEKARKHVISDVFAAFAIVDAKAPFLLQYILSTFNSKMDAENSLLELEAVEVPAVNKTACRKRKPNFSAQEIAVIAQRFEENQAVLKSKFILTQPLYNKMKRTSF